MLKSVAIIPARGGSKRLPRKNIKEFCGAPIISYSINAAIKAGIFSTVMVSTDDDEIAQIARNYGAEVPFLRSEATSNDFASTADVLKEVLMKFQEMGKNFEYFCCLYATAPFVTHDELISTMALLEKTGADSVVPVVRFGYSIQRSLKIENGRLMMNWPENYSKRSQDLPAAYHDAGQFYCMRTSSFFQQHKLFANFMVPYEISESEAQDIDTEEDWKMAEIKFRTLNKVRI
jgi:N-acylneuraminate cytidylyltransferase